MQFKNQPLELDIEQHSGPKSGKEYVKVICCHPTRSNDEIVVNNC